MVITVLILVVSFEKLRAWPQARPDRQVSRDHEGGADTSAVRFHPEDIPRAVGFQTFPSRGPTQVLSL